MRKWMIFILFSPLCHFMVNGQGCLPDGIVIENQSQIDNFQLEYPNCTEIEGDVFIDGWAGDITDLSGLNSVSKIGGSFYIWDCYLLESLAGLENIDTIIGRFEIHQNNLLVNLQGLNGLKQVGESFWIYSNEELISLDGLEALSSVGIGLSIFFNDNIVSLESLSNLSEINEILNISANLKLTSLSGLDNVIPDSINQLYIGYNPLLATCEVQSVCDYLLLPNGNTIIEQNAPGCSSPSEVEDACENVGYNHSFATSGISVFPNPANDLVYIVNHSTDEITEVSIYNMHGSKVLSIYRSTTLSISKLKCGDYIIEIVTENAVVRKMLLIQ